MEEKILTCISCPIGCQLAVTLDNGTVAAVTGNLCPRGVTYAKAESVNPTRMVTSSVRLEGGTVAMLPVKTAEPIPKSKIMECAIALKNVEAKAPIRAGEIVVPNTAGTGVPIIASRGAERR